MVKLSLECLTPIATSCPEFGEWWLQQPFANAWKKCKRPDWLLLVARRMLNSEQPDWPDRTWITQAAANCAREVLPQVDKPYRKAAGTCLDMTDAWASNPSRAGKLAVREANALLYPAFNVPDSVDNIAAVNAVYLTAASVDNVGFTCAAVASAHWCCNGPAASGPAQDLAAIVRETLGQVPGT